MFSYRCGREIEEGSAYCLYCGTKMPLDDLDANLKSYQFSPVSGDNIKMDYEQPF